METPEEEQDAELHALAYPIDSKLDHDADRNLILRLQPTPKRMNVAVRSDPMMVAMPVIERLM